MKNERLKSKNKRRALAHCLLSIKVLALVYVRRQKKKKKNCGYKHRPFVSDDQIQNIFWSKRTANKDGP